MSLRLLGRAGAERVLRFPKRREIRYSLERGETNADFSTVGAPGQGSDWRDRVV